jgi:hypothetical protein
MALVLFILGAAVFFMVVMFGIGDRALRTTVTGVGDMFISSTASEFIDISNHDSSMLASTLYIALKKNQTQVISVTGTAHGINVNSIDDLKGIFHQKIYVTVMRSVTDPDLFQFTISD